MNYTFHYTLITHLCVISFSRVIVRARTIIIIFRVAPKTSTFFGDFVKLQRGRVFVARFEEKFRFYNFTLRGADPRSWFRILRPRNRTTYLNPATKLRTQRNESRSLSRRPPPSHPRPVDVFSCYELLLHSRFALRTEFNCTYLVFYDPQQCVHACT